MATLPADEDYARALLSIFVFARAHSGQSLEQRAVRGAFLSRNYGRANDFDAALDFAASQGWVTLALDRIRLTSIGESEFS